MQCFFNVTFNNNIEVSCFHSREVYVHESQPFATLYSDIKDLYDILYIDRLFFMAPQTQKGHIGAWQMIQHM